MSIIPVPQGPVLRAALAATLVLITAPSALAQTPTQQQQTAIRNVCQADYRNNCSSVPTGGQAALRCLQQHAETLSRPCQQALAALGGA
jgi:hypothetical protein